MAGTEFKRSYFFGFRNTNCIKILTKNYKKHDDKKAFTHIFMIDRKYILDKIFLTIKP